MGIEYATESAHSLAIVVTRQTMCLEGQSWYCARYNSYSTPLRTHLLRATDSASWFTDSDVKGVQRVLIEYFIYRSPVYEDCLIASPFKTYSLAFIRTYLRL